MAPAVAAHLLALALVLALPHRPASVSDRPLPTWALALAPAPAVEPDYLELPAPPAAIRLPAAAAVQPPIPSAAGDATAPPPAGPSGESRTATGAPAPASADSGAAGPPPAAVGSRPRRPLSERLTPGHGDPRLWFPLPQEIVGLSADQIMQLDLDLAIADVADSLRAAEAAGRRAKDWTYVDSQGRRWGVAPGQNGMVNLYVGNLTIPIPFGFAAPRTAEALRVAQQDAEIEMQAARAGVTAVLRDRAAEIRRRKDAERAKAREAAQSRGVGRDRDSQPDTTGGD